MVQCFTIEKLKQKTGHVWLTRDYTAERERIKRFVEVVGGDTPLWQEEVPPSWLLAISLEQVCEQLAALPQAALHGSCAIELFAPVKVGDIVTVVVKVSSVRERQQATFVILEIEQHNQSGVMLARCKQVIVLRSKT
ncbi:MAG: MaoC family dehydratase N-terminal domain-containing protein [Dehalococcoidia bacterium]|nr:MaoC family dehydratase N-terminal domain-containing protein [Dehalococcoidia bacterium]